MRPSASPIRARLSDNEQACVTATSPVPRTTLFAGPKTRRTAAARRGFNDFTAPNTELPDRCNIPHKTPDNIMGSMVEIVAFPRA